LEWVPSKAVLSVASLRQYTLSINGKPAAAPLRRGSELETTRPVRGGPELHAGENQIAVTVFNTNGPPVLWLSLDTGGWQLTAMGAGKHLMPARRGARRGLPANPKSPLRRPGLRRRRALGQPARPLADLPAFHGVIGWWLLVDEQKT